MQTLLQKWWLILLQGILLIVLSIYIFNHPGATLISLTFWISFLILGAGVAGIIGWLMLDKFDRSNSDLLWSIATALLGILLLAKIGFAMDLVTDLLGIWMIITGAWLVKNGWDWKSEGAMGWIMIITGVLSIIAGIIVIFNIAVGAVAVSAILGFQLLLAGIGLVILSLVKRKVAKEVSARISDLKGKV